ncbi:MAG: hypothetical protein JNK05_39990 [Myxococcales bacterium]|nr:hypothetical protein [Myxococcales bacterium]
MKPRVRRPKSTITSHKKALAEAVPDGLPKSVRAFYGRCDGLVVEHDIDGATEEARIESLEGMFAGDFTAPVAHKSAEAAIDAMSEGPFCDELYSPEIDIANKRDLARANLLLRLKLVTRIPGESAAIAVDLYSGSDTPKLYFVQDARDAWPLELTFEAFVTLFQKYGARRWYFAFLDAKAGREMNIDLGAEFDASMAPFSDDAVSVLRSRIRPAKSPSVTRERPAKSERPATSADDADDEASIERWWRAVPALGVPYLEDRWERDVGLLLARGAAAVGAERTLELVTAGLRAAMKKPPSGFVWAFHGTKEAALIAAPNLTDKEVVLLVDWMFIPAEALVVLARRRGWSAAKLDALSKATQYGVFEKARIMPRTSEVFAKAAARMK